MRVDKSLKADSSQKSEMSERLICRDVSVYAVAWSAVKQREAEV
jgi:hypothetical protein